MVQSRYIDSEGSGKMPGRVWRAPVRGCREAQCRHDEARNACSRRAAGAGLMAAVPDGRHVLAFARTPSVDKEALARILKPGLVNLALLKLGEIHAQSSATAIQAGMLRLHPVLRLDSAEEQHRLPGSRGAASQGSIAPVVGRRRVKVLGVLNDCRSAGSPPAARA
eukprot:scaffold2519_cov108-Isochrysis_galbana.AAC.5